LPQSKRVAAHTPAGSAEDVGMSHRSESERIDPVDQLFELKPPPIPEMQTTREGVAAFAAAAGDLHGYAIELALKIMTLTPSQLRQAGERAVARLKDQGGLSQGEAEALRGLMAAIDDPDLDRNEEVLRATSAKLAKCGPVAAMLLAIARDSMARDRKRARSHRQERSLVRSIFAWSADVVAGGLAGGGAGAALSWTGPGGIAAGVAVGTIAATAASGAVLAA
jgi:hypothetical protein